MIQSKIEGKVAIVTGASSGIGEQTSILLAKNGAKVALVARQLDALERVERIISDAGGQAMSVVADVTDHDQVKKAINKVIDAWGKVDLLIVNAGAYIRSPIETLTISALQKSMAVNFYGGVYFILGLLPLMMEQRSGHIVVVTSMDAKKGLPLDAPYVAAKYAMSGLAEVMRQELKAYGILVTTVFPGRVDTPLIDNLEVPWISAKIKPIVVAKKIVDVIKRYRPEVILPRQAGLLYYVNVFSPRLGDYLVKSLRLEGWYRENESEN